MSQPTLSKSLLNIQQKEAVKIIAFNAPEVRNAVDYPTMNALREAVEASADDGTRCIVITGSTMPDGSAPSFCSGLNLKTAAASSLTPDETFKGLRESFQPAVMAIRNARMPVIAAVDGYAGGFGCDIALTCDLRLITERARFGELFIRIGLIPDGGGTYLLPRLVGLGRALELMFTGRDVDAEEALQIGLANRVIPHEQFMEDVLAFAQKLASQSPLALGHGKAAMWASLEGSYDDALLREAEGQRDLLTSEDGQEGFRAFLEKRQPVWKGR
jgi:2-(1,2-epoxy-1,2-dihydrophenyl)acetyl-CoA isomerase